MKRIASNILLGIFSLLVIINFMTTKGSWLLIILILSFGAAYAACGTERAIFLRLLIVIIMFGGTLLFESSRFKKDPDAIQNTYKISADSLSVGDFIKFGDGWYPIKSIVREKGKISRIGIKTLGWWDTPDIRKISALKKIGNPGWIAWQ